MPATDERIELENGKYAFYIQDGHLRCDRHGEPWPAFQPTKAAHALYRGLLALRRDLERTHVALDKVTAVFHRDGPDLHATRNAINTLRANHRDHALPITASLVEPSDEDSRMGSADIGPCATCGGTAHAGECR